MQESSDNSFFPYCNALPQSEILHAIQTVKRDYNFQRGPTKANPTNIKLKTPVSFC